MAAWHPSVGFATSAGELDSSFNVGLSGSGANALLLQPDGKVIIAGTFTYYHNVFRQRIARLNDDASLDPSFDAGNLAGSGNGVIAAYLYPDGRILVAGGFYSAGRNRIARLNSNGTLDPSFDPGAGPNSDIQCLAMQPDGKIVIGGIFSSVAGQPHARLARLNSDGSLDTNFVASADNDVHALVLQPDGKILVAGWFSHLNGASPAYLARLNADGTWDASFATSVTMPVECLGLQPDGRILIGGSFNFSGGSPLARVMPNGSWDLGFSATLGHWVHVVQLQEDGRILIGGSFTTVNGTSRPYMARLYSDGSTDLSFSSAPDNVVNHIAIQPDGRFIIAGGFGTVGGTNEAGLARLQGDDRTQTPTLQFNGMTFKSYQSDAGVTIPVFRSGNLTATLSVQYATADLEAQAGTDYLSTAGTLLFGPGEVAKSFTVPLLNDGEVEGFERFAAFLTNAVGGTLGSITNGTVTVLGVNAAVQIVTPDIVTNELAGTLKLTLTRLLTNLTCSVQCQAINGTALAGVNYSNLTQTVTFAAGQATTSVSVTLLDDDQPGPDTSFTVQLSNPVHANLGARSNLTITIQDNDAPNHPAFGFNGIVNAVTPSADGGILLGGNFSSINGTPRNRLGKVLADGSVDPGFDPGTGADNAVSAVVVQADGKIVCGGNFTTYDGVSRVRAMRLKGDGTVDADFNPGAGAGGIVRALVPGPEGGYFAGGSFTSYGGAARQGVVRINSDGSVNTNFVPQIPSSFYAICLAAQAGGSLLVGSDNPFGLNTNICVRFKPDGSRDPGFTNRITALSGIARINSLVPQSDGKILVGGYFSHTGIARLNTNGSPDTSFAPSGGVASGSIGKLLLLTNGQTIAVGSFGSYAGVPRSGIVRINSNGSIDPSFDPGLGADSTIMDVAPLPGNRLAIGGSFRRFAGFPRYGFAILSSDGQLITRAGFESFAVSSTLQFGLRVEPEKSFELLASSDLMNWQVLYSNLLHQSFTNLALPSSGGDRQFFRILQNR